MKRSNLPPVLLAILCLSSICPAQEDGVRIRDGNWWNQQDQVAQTIYVIGFFDGVSLGNKFSMWRSMKGSTPNFCASAAMASFAHYNDKFLTRVAASQLSDGLTVFYKDFRNRSIEISNAVWIVLNEIAGEPREHTDKMTENFRRNSAR